MEKDIDLVLDAADEAGVELPLTSEMKALLRAAIEAGYADDDFIALFLHLRSASGFEEERAPRPGGSAVTRPTRSVGSPDATRAVDWEQRIDFPRLRQDRLDRAKASLEASDLGAVLLFDPNNIRYVTSTHIGEWARDKNARFTLLPRGARSDPVGLRLRRAPPPAVRPLAPAGELPRRRRADARRDARRDRDPGPARPRRSRHELRELGLQDEPLGIDMADLVTIEALQRAGVHVTDGSQVLLEARKIKTAEEIALLDQSAGLVDAVYEEIYRMLRPGVYEHEIVARAHQLLFEMGSEQVEAVNAVSGDRCNPHPHVFSDRLLRPGDQAFFDIIHSFMGYRTCYYRTFNVGGVNHAQLDAYKQCREWLDAAIALVRPGHDDGQDRRGLADRPGARLPGRGDVLRPPVRARHRCRALRVADDLACPLPRAPGRARGGDGVRARDVLRGDRRPLRGAHRGGGRRHGDGLRRDHALPGRGAARRRPHLRARRRSRRRPAARARRRPGLAAAVASAAVVEPAGVPR